MGDTSIYIRSVEDEDDDSIYIKHFNKRENHHFQSFVIGQWELYKCFTEIGDAKEIREVSNFMYLEVYLYRSSLELEYY